MRLIKMYKWKIFGWYLLVSRKSIRYYPVYSGLTTTSHHQPISSNADGLFLLGQMLKMRVGNKVFY